MKFFIDTANISEIKEGLALGMVDGVTTNPSLIAKEKRGFDSVVKEILEIVEGPVSLEVLSLEAKGMFAEGKKLARLGDQVVIKVPMTTEGLKATKNVCGRRHRCKSDFDFFSASGLDGRQRQARRYVSPFVGRLDDIAHDGMELTQQILDIYDNYEYDTEVIVASIRHPKHVLDAALMGADIATIPFKVIAQLAQHPLTDKGIALFLEDWKKVPKK